MAGMKSIDQARDRMEEAALLATETIRAMYSVLDAAHSADTPPWLFVLSRHIEAWNEAMGSYMDAVHQHARPVLDQIENTP